MKKITRYILGVMLLLLTFNLCLVKAKAETNPSSITWSASDSYLTSNYFESAPLTVEAKIKLPAGYTERAGVILSNYGDKVSKGYMMFEIFTNGNPSITLVDVNGVKVGGLYKNINVATGEWVNLTFVIDGNKHHCYVDGELKDTKTFNLPYENHIPIGRFGVGGDRCTGNPRYFKGEIAELAVYSDVRSAEEVKNDHLSTAIDNDNLLVGYNLSNLTSLDVIEDVSVNDNDLRKQYFADTTTTDPTDYDYSIAVVGDTQTINRDRPEHMKTIYDYIVNNVEAKKIKHVAGMGDITDQSQDREYNTAIEQFKRMDGLVPYSLIRGNHDSIDSYEKYLGVNSTYCGYSSQYKEYYLNSTNSIHEFSAGNLDYLLVTLDFGPSDDVLRWASDVIERHPYHNVIISTHGYLDTKGLLIRKSSTNSITQHGGYNDGVEIWEKLVSRHKNIVMVLCGHEAVDDVVVNKAVGVHGNVVTQILVDTQYTDRDDIRAGGDGLGVVTMMYFSNGGKTIDLRYYATIKGYYHTTCNQFRMNINVISRKIDSVKDGIANLPTKDNITLENEEEVLELNKLYLSLTEEEKATIDNTKLNDALNQIDIFNAKEFNQKVLELPNEIKYEDKDILLSMKEIYENSSDLFKQNVEQREVFENKLAELMVLVHKENSHIINKEILHLPNPISLNEKDLVLELRVRYEALDDASKANVTYLSKLVEAEAVLNILSKQLEDAILVDEMIGNLPDVIDLSCEEEVILVRQKYAKLDSVAKGYVTKLEELEKAEALIMDAYSKIKAKDLNEMILSLPDDISLTDKGILITIRNRYDLLDEDSKKYVSELFLLETFEARIKVLEQMKRKVDRLNSKVDSLPSKVSLDDKGLVEGLLDEYNNLTEEEKQFFNKKNKLDSALIRIEELENQFFTPTVVICGLVVLLWAMSIGCSIFIKRLKTCKKG